MNSTSLSRFDRVYSSIPLVDSHDWQPCTSLGWYFSHHFGSFSDPRPLLSVLLRTKRGYPFQLYSMMNLQYRILFLGMQRYFLPVDFLILPLHWASWRNGYHHPMTLLQPQLKRRFFLYVMLIFWITIQLSEPSTRILFWSPLLKKTLQISLPSTPISTPSCKRAPLSDPRIPTPPHGQLSEERYCFFADSTLMEHFLDVCTVHIVSQCQFISITLFTFGLGGICLGYHFWQRSVIG